MTIAIKVDCNNYILQNEPVLCKLMIQLDCQLITNRLSWTFDHLKNECKNDCKLNSV